MKLENLAIFYWKMVEMHMNFSYFFFVSLKGKIAELIASFVAAVEDLFHREQSFTIGWNSLWSNIRGAKYLIFVSSRSVKTRELSFAIFLALPKDRREG